MEKEEPILTTLVDHEAVLPVLQNNKKVTEIKAIVKDGFAVAEIDFQKVDSTKYNEWDKKLDPNTGDLKISELLLKVSCEKAEIPIRNKPFINRNGNQFKLKAATIVYHIYHDGKIEKNRCINPQKVKYKYFEANSKERLLGKSKIIEVDKWKYKGTKLKPIQKIKLVDVRNFKKYTSSTVKFEIIKWNTKNSKRYYIGLDCFAGLLGGMIEESLVDICFNGFSDKNGAPGGSREYINGVAGDLRYLSTNQNGEVIYLSYHTFDYKRQVKFNNALFKFGWGRTRKMYSENFKRKTIIINPKTKKKKSKKNLKQLDYHIPSI